MSTGTDLNALADQLRAPGVKWRTYVNPQRNDGLFVAEDKEIEAYPGVSGEGGQLLYPAVPTTTHSLQYQLPHEDAEALVRLLNAPQLKIVDVKPFEDYDHDARGTIVTDHEVTIENESGKRFTVRVPVEGTSLGHVWDAKHPHGLNLVYGDGNHYA